APAAVGAPCSSRSAAPTAADCFAGPSPVHSDAVASGSANSPSTVPAAGSTCLDEVACVSLVRVQFDPRLEPNAYPDFAVAITSIVQPLPVSPATVGVPYSTPVVDPIDADGFDGPSPVHCDAVTSGSANSPTTVQSAGSKCFDQVACVSLLRVQFDPRLEPNA